MLRVGAGFTGRANSALVVDEPPLPLAAAVPAVAGWYADRGLRPRAQLPVPGAEAADAAFEAARWPAGYRYRGAAPGTDRRRSPP